MAQAGDSVRASQVGQAVCSCCKSSCLTERSIFSCLPLSRRTMAYAVRPGRSLVSQPACLLLTRQKRECGVISDQLQAADVPAVERPCHRGTCKWQGGVMLGRSQRGWQMTMEMEGAPVALRCWLAFIFRKMHPISAWAHRQLSNANSQQVVFLVVRRSAYDETLADGVLLD